MGEHQRRLRLPDSLCWRCCWSPALTSGYLYGLIASVTGVICVNYMFTSPYWAFNFTLSGYPLTFLTFLAVSVITSTLTTQIKQQERLRAEGEKEKMRANLLRSVSHDIRTPLTSIVGATSTLLENPGLSAQKTAERTADGCPGTSPSG